MMKKIVIILCGLCCAFGAYAQQGGRSGAGFAGQIETRTSFCSLNDRSGFNASEFAVMPGYRFNDRFALKLIGTETIGLFKWDTNKHYETVFSLGLGAGCNLLRPSSSGELELGAEVGYALDNSAWKFVCYDLGLRYGASSVCNANLYMGLGVRYYDSVRSGFTNYCNMYIAIGYRFGY